MVTVLIFTLGLVAGSFLNVVIYRLPRRQSVNFPPSHCPRCNTRLKPRDLIPVWSWISLGGRCRYCAGPIPVRYPLVELFTAFIFLILSLHFQGIELIGYCLLAAVLIAAAVIDYRHGIIPNTLTGWGFLLGLAVSLFNPAFTWWQHLLGVLAGGGVLLALALVSRGGMGGGDIKLAAVMGLVLGPRLVLVALFLGAAAAAGVGMLLIITGRKGRKDTLVFGPFLAAGALLSILWGNHLLTWYISTF